ncbi:hypothetical protein ETAA8_52300 [Anatilimnocola aggregata]|uniref:Carboxypeptidase regulatory-like domain-containing protein n=1 Tax=Anatilimnocola aggregata TaxID=2528021 RepID=A0A517YIT2_9BACT|nr:carboxypeptidase regulatory-like domain-containing protein [Anatilimnocola aggregata]QDU30111.1 hypothetical protein ETAA8_52300 [Anatilimnocola aggregata]
MLDLFPRVPRPERARNRIVAFLFLIDLAVILGCGPRPVTGGTKGILRSGGAPLSDFQLTVHAEQGGLWSPVGFAVSTADGSFELVTNGAKGSLFLDPGEYRCTVESAGAPLKVPAKYAQVESTPLKVTWPTATNSLELELPPLPMIR